MATAAESLGTLYTDYNNYPESGYTPTNFEDYLVLEFNAVEK
jgi:hypothetical protein